MGGVCGYPWNSGGGPLGTIAGLYESGIDAVMSQSRLREAMADADWVITGEGRFDEQSLRGKVVSGVSRLAGQTGARVAVLAGQVMLTAEKYRAAGVETAIACMEGEMKLEDAIAKLAHQ